MVMCMCIMIMMMRMVLLLAMILLYMCVATVGQFGSRTDTTGGISGLLVNMVWLGPCLAHIGFDQIVENFSQYLLYLCVGMSVGSGSCCH